MSSAKLTPESFPPLDGTMQPFEDADESSKDLQWMTTFCDQKVLSWLEKVTSEDSPEATFIEDPAPFTSGIDMGLDDWHTLAGPVGPDQVHAHDARGEVPQNILRHPKVEAKPNVSGHRYPSAVEIRGPSQGLVEASADVSDARHTWETAHYMVHHGYQGFSNGYNQRPSHIPFGQQIFSQAFPSHPQQGMIYGHQNYMFNGMPYLPPPGMPFQPIAQVPQVQPCSHYRQPAASHKRARVSKRYINSPFETRASLTEYLNTNSEFKKARNSDKLKCPYQGQRLRTGNICNKELMKGNVAKHIRVCHAGAAAATCSLCGKELSTLHSVKRHKQDSCKGRKENRSDGPEVVRGTSQDSWQPQDTEKFTFTYPVAQNGLPSM